MGSATNEVAIVGAAAHRIGRLAPTDPEQGESFEFDLLLETVASALAGSSIPSQAVGSVLLTLPSASTRQLGMATMLAARLGLRCTGQIATVVEMGLTGGLAFDQACNDVALGRSRFALACGVSFDSATPPAIAMNQGMRVVGDVDYQSPFGITPISWYALDATRYMHEHGVQRAQLAHIAVKNRRHALYNPLAQFRLPLSLDDVLRQRPIVEPLGLYEVPAIGDGAICVIVADVAAARELGQPFVTVRGRGFAHDGFHPLGDRAHDMTRFPAAEQACGAALEDAGVAIADIDVAELYAPCTITEAIVTESAGICARGQGALAALGGETTLGGRLPVNTSGGCLSRGHPPAVSGLYGMLELREQLLGRAGLRQVNGARLAMASSEGGNYNSALVHVLEGPQ
ncbi:MAG: thiolase family protein [Steroidobacteraceae bacterium]